MTQDARQIARERRRLAAADQELASELAAELEEHAATAARDRRAQRRRIIAGCLVAAGLGLSGTILVATKSSRPVPITASASAPETAVASSPTMPAPTPPRVERVSLRELERRAVFREIVLAGDRAERDTHRFTPHSGRLTPRERLERAKRHHAKFQQLAERRREELDGSLAARFGITREEIAEIEREGALKDWGYEVPGPIQTKTVASRPRSASSRGPARPSPPQQAP